MPNRYPPFYSTIRCGLAAALLFLLGPSLAAQCDTALTAHFWYGYMDESRVVFYDRSEGAQEIRWDFGEGEVISVYEGSVVVEFPSDTAAVCLTALAGPDCRSTYCLRIYRGAPEELCQWTDCVWPGDANGDRKANNYDLLNIGVGYGQAGPERAGLLPGGDPTAWAPFYADDWDQHLQVVNFKHLDCDGDGFVDAADVEAIYKNYQPEWEWQSEPTPGAPPVLLHFDREVVQVNVNDERSLEMTVEVYVGTEEQPVKDWHGIAFNLLFDSDYLAPGSVEVEYDTNSIFGPAEAVLTLQEDLGSNRNDLTRVDLAFTQKGGRGANGFSRVATVRFVVISDIIIGLQEQEQTDLKVILERVRVIRSDGRLAPFDNPAGTATVTLQRDVTASVNDPDLLQRLHTFPNPAAEVLYVEWETLQPRGYQLINGLGQLVREGLLIDSPAALSLRGLDPGVYWLRVLTAEGLLTRKVMVTGE